LINYDIVLLLNDNIVQGGVFNLASVLGAQRCNGIELYPFTCGCGEPGCAGFFTKVKQFRNESTVKWIFPSTKEYKVDKLEYCFDVKQFDFQVDVLKFLVINLANKKKYPIYCMSSSDYNLLGDINYRKKRFRRASNSYEDLKLNFPEYINNTYYYKYEEQVSWEYDFQDLVYMLIGEQPEYAEEEFNMFLLLCRVGAKAIVQFLSDDKLLFNSIFENKKLSDLCYKLNDVDNFDLTKLELVQK
jgi:hypothetical protein